MLDSHINPHTNYCPARHIYYNIILYYAVAYTLFLNVGGEGKRVSESINYGGKKNLDNKMIIIVSDLGRGVRIDRPNHFLCINKYLYGITSVQNVYMIKIVFSSNMRNVIDIINNKISNR